MSDLVAAGLLDPVAAGDGLPELVTRTRTERDLLEARQQVALEPGPGRRPRHPARPGARGDHLPAQPGAPAESCVMGRPATGTRRRRGNLWIGGVPCLGDPTRRVETSFASEAAREAWIAEQLARRARGLEPELPVRHTGVAAGPRGRPVGSFETVARQWHEERYVEMEHAGVERR